MRQHSLKYIPYIIHRKLWKVKAVIDLLRLRCVLYSHKPNQVLTTQILHELCDHIAVSCLQSEITFVLLIESKSNIGRRSAREKFASVLPDTMIVESIFQTIKLGLYQRRPEPSYK